MPNIITIQFVVGGYTLETDFEGVGPAPTRLIELDAAKAEPWKYITLVFDPNVKQATIYYYQPADDFVGVTVPERLRVEIEASLGFYQELLIYLQFDADDVAPHKAMRFSLLRIVGKQNQKATKPTLEKRR